MNFQILQKLLEILDERGVNKKEDLKNPLFSYHNVLKFSSRQANRQDTTGVMFQTCFPAFSTKRIKT